MPTSRWLIFILGCLWLLGTLSPQGLLLAHGAGIATLRGPSSTTVYLPLIQGQTPTTEPSCYGWDNQVPLQQAVTQHPCVQMSAGVYTTHTPIRIPSGHQLYGQGAERTFLLAVPPWQEQAENGEGVVHTPDGADITVAGFTIDANHLATFGLGVMGMTVDAMRIMNATCDGIAIAGPGTVIRASIIENNGENCRSGVPGSGIYITSPLDSTSVARYAPVIQDNVIRFNGGPGLDVDRVWGGTFRNNQVYTNQAWTAISFFAASEWLVEDNTVNHPKHTTLLHPGHPECQGGPQGGHPAAIQFCQQTGLDYQATTHNLVRGNQFVGWYGILVIGNDEAGPEWVPRFNHFENNRVAGSEVGCADDFAPNQGLAGLNSWVDNNCAGRPDSLPLYFESLCPGAVRRSTLQTWQLGKRDAATVNTYIALFNDLRGVQGGEFATGATIPRGAVIATNYAEGGTTWPQFPVTPVVHYQSYGLFESHDSYIAPFAGACLLIVP